jgi:hypothetical protein
MASTNDKGDTMRMILAVLLTGAALVVAAGCGGSSNNASGTTTAADTTTAAADTTMTDTTSTDTTMTDTTMTDTAAADTTAATAGLSAGCQKVADLSVQFGKALSAAGATGSGQTDVQKTAAAYKAFADQVPEEIRGSFQTLASAFALYAKALQGVDLSSGKTPDAATIAKLAKAAQALDNEALTAANTKIEAWVKKNCTTGG